MNLNEIHACSKRYENVITIKISENSCSITSESE